MAHIDDLVEPGLEQIALARLPPFPQRGGDTRQSALILETFCVLASQCVRGLEGFKVNVFGADSGGGGPWNNYLLCSIKLPVTRASFSTRPIPRRAPKRLCLCGSWLPALVGAWMVLEALRAKMDTNGQVAEKTATLTEAAHTPLGPLHSVLQSS